MTNTPRLVASFALSLALAALLTAGRAAACSDAGPPNACNEGGAAWIACSVHADCPTGQNCHQDGYCMCFDCYYGETCDATGCQCAAQTRPEAPMGCEVRQDSCGTYQVHCEDDAGVPMCSTDAAPPGACEPPDTPGDMSSAGCSAAPTRAAPLGALVLAALGLMLARRRRAGR